MNNLILTGCTTFHNPTTIEIGSDSSIVRISDSNIKFITNNNTIILDENEISFNINNTIFKLNDLIEIKTKFDILESKFMELYYAPNNPGFYESRDDFYSNVNK